MAKKSFINTLLERRIPQILGSYLVAGTSLILFIEYLINKYQFPSHYPTLALFALIGILPSVIILSYFHGTPGKDEWTKVERIGIPINVLFIAGILFFGDSINIWKIEPIIENANSNVEKQIKEKIDSYYINFTSNPLYIDDLYHKYSEFDVHINKNDYLIQSIDDSLLESIKKQCFNYLNVKFQNKGIDISSNFNNAHISTMDSLPHPSNYDRNNSVPYPVNELSRLLNLDEKDVPKVFVDILIYTRKNLESDKENIFYAGWRRIRQQGNLSLTSPKYFDNNNNGIDKLIEHLKEHLFYNLDLISFSKNPFEKWIGEIKEILPNNMINIKLYASNNIKSNLKLEAQIMYRFTVKSMKEFIEDTQIGINYLEKNKAELSDSLYEQIYELEKYNNKAIYILDSLITYDIYKPGTNWVANLGYNLEVITVMDTIAVCKLLNKEKPWATVKVGHKLIISE